MRSLTIAIFSLVVALSGQPAAAQTLWQNVHFGMSIGDVRAAQPTANTQAVPSKMGNGATCELKISSTDVGTDTYNVCFFFKDEKLLQVTLSANDDPSQRQYETVIALLKSKYGNELSQRRMALGYEADWLLPSGTSINVMFLDFGDSPNVLEVSYQTRLANAARSL